MPCISGPVVTRFRLLAGAAGCVLSIALAAGLTEAQVQLSVVMSLDKAVVTQHEPVFLRIAIENSSQQGVVINLGHQDEKLDIRVTNPLGSTELRPRPVKAGWSSPDVLDAPPSGSSAAEVPLNSWFAFHMLGHYRIDLALHPDSLPEEPFLYTLVGNSAVLDLTVLPRDPASLESACASLVETIRNAGSASATAAAANALSAIDDPAAVPFAVQALKKPEFAALMIGALARLRTDEAVRALVSASKSGDRETSSLARSALAALGKSRAP